jgi:CRISPR-associated protein Cas2
MRFVICYDVVEDPRRTKVAHLLEDHGLRVQYSVFECELNEAQLIGLQQKLSELIDLTTDSIRIYRLCTTCREAVNVSGRGPIWIPERVAII